MAGPAVDLSALAELAVSRVQQRAALTPQPLHLDVQATPKQQEFLALDVQEALYGGAAGGGKSIALLLGALQYAHVPGYSALLLRRTYADLAKPGALIPRSHELLQGKANWNEQKKMWTFGSGATLSFGYLENANDKYQYQGAEYQYIGFDELTQFDQPDYLYLFSRLRRPDALTVPLRMRAASNPGGRGAAWVFARFVEPVPQSPDCVFVPARLVDNPHLDQVEYRKSLSRLDPLTQRQLLEGDWNTREGVAFPEFSRARHVIPTDYGMIEGWRRVAGHDWGYSSPGAHLWFAIDPNGGAVAYREWLFKGLDPAEIAQGILYRQGDEPVLVYADPSCWQERRRADLTQDQISLLAQNGRLQLSKAEQYQQAGLSVQPANNQRVAGKQRLHTLLRDRGDGVPYLRFMDCCPGAVRVMQAIQLDPERGGEDVITDYLPDDELRDEYYDACRYALMGVPTKVTQPPRKDPWAAATKAWNW